MHAVAAHGHADSKALREELRSALKDEPQTLVMEKSV
jgi:hypothetical protein